MPDPVMKVSDQNSCIGAANDPPRTGSLTKTTLASIVVTVVAMVAADQANLAASATTETANADGPPLGPPRAQTTGAYATPYDYSPKACSGGNDTAFLQSAMNKLQAQNNAGGERGILDLRGGTCRISAPITMTGTPYNIGIHNGSIIPYGSFAGTFFDFSGTKTITNLEMVGLNLNGFGQATDLINLGPKTQGIWIRHNTLMGFTRHAIFNPTKAAGAGMKITENVIQGGKEANAGTAIEAYGNDSEIRMNEIYNINVGIRLHGGGYTLALNHIFPIEGTEPIPLIYLDGVGQIQIIDNYFDDGYVYIEKYASVNQINNNRFLMNGGPHVNMTLPSGVMVPYSPIVLAPQSADYDLFDFSVVGNNFINTAGVYKPVYVDTSRGAITRCQSTHMGENGFTGYKAMYTHPVLKGSLWGATKVSLNYAGSVPWCAPASIQSLVAPGAAISSAPILGSTVTLNMSTAYRGPYSVGVTVNSNSSTDGN